MKPCKICAKEIPDQARKCTACGEFQSLPSRVLAGLDLKGLLALLPLLALIYAFLAERLEVPRSDLRVVPVQCARFGVTIFASNTGNRMSLLESARFAAGSEDSSAFKLPEDLSLRVFEAGASRLITLTVDPTNNPNGLASHASTQSQDCRVTLDFRILRYDHSKEERTASCDCPASS